MSCSVYYLYFRVFLAGQFESLHAHLEAMIPANKRAFLSQFYSQVSSERIILQSFVQSSQLRVRKMTWHKESNKACTDSTSDGEYCPGITAASLQKCGLKSYWLWSGRLHAKTEQLLQENCASCHSSCQVSWVIWQLHVITNASTEISFFLLSAFVQINMKRREDNSKTSSLQSRHQQPICIIHTHVLYSSQKGFSE